MLPLWPPTANTLPMTVATPTPPRGVVSSETYSQRCMRGSKRSTELSGELSSKPPARGNILESRKRKRIDCLSRHIETETHPRRRGSRWACWLRCRRGAGPSRSPPSTCWGEGWTAPRWKAMPRRRCLRPHTQSSGRGVGRGRDRRRHVGRCQRGYATTETSGRVSPRGPRTPRLPWECSWAPRRSSSRPRCRNAPRRWSRSCRPGLRWRRWGRRELPRRFPSWETHRRTDTQTTTCSNLI